MRNATEERRKARWMSDFEDNLLELMPEARGKIEWASAEHFCYSGLTPMQAARRYHQTHGSDCAQ